MQNCGDKYKDQQLPGFRDDRERDEEVEHREFLDCDIILHDAAMVDAWHYAFAKVCKVHNTKSGP